MCYVSLGTNRGNRSKNIEQAIAEISQNIGAIIRKSSIYESEPWGFKDAVSFYNLVLKVETPLSAQQVLDHSLLIESKMGRTRSKKGYEGRIIDIDLLFFDREIIYSPELILPHPEIQNRRFILEPTCEIDENLIHPKINKSMRNLLSSCKDSCWIKLVL